MFARYTLILIVSGIIGIGAVLVLKPNRTMIIPRAERAFVGARPQSAGVVAASAPPTPTATAPPTSTTTATTSTPAAPAKKTAPTPAAPTAITANGQDYPNPWGDVQVQVTVKGGRIVAVKPVAMPQSPPSVYAAPELIQEAIAAQSANIQGVSGATYTSESFKQSLQSALNAAHFKA